MITWINGIMIQGTVPEIKELLQSLEQTPTINTTSPFTFDGTATIPINTTPRVESFEGGNNAGNNTTKSEDTLPF
jgi:hypothetical protein